MSGKELAKFGHRTTENECYPVVDTAFGARSIRGIRSAGTTTVGQSAARCPSRRISAPTILHSDPTSLERQNASMDRASRNQAFCPKPSPAGSRRQPSERDCLQITVVSEQNRFQGCQPACCGRARRGGRPGCRCCFVRAKSRTLGKQAGSGRCHKTIPTDLRCPRPASRTTARDSRQRDPRPQRRLLRRSPTAPGRIRRSRRTLRR